MTPATLLIASTIVFLVLAIWFGYEERSQQRLGKTLRVFFDAKVDQLQNALERSLVHVGSGTLLRALNLVWHSVLLLLQHLVMYCERGVETMISRNARSAKRLEAERLQRTSDSALAQIAAHKATVSLTEKQKEAKRRAHLEGRV